MNPLLEPTLPKLLGACFYYSPDSVFMQEIIPVLPEFSEVFPWHDPDAIEVLISRMDQLAPQALRYDFSILFEGQGTMPALPWGSVHLEVDQLLMGESTLAFRHFLQDFNLEIQTHQNEPDDQFGLMLMSLAYLMENNEEDGVKTLLQTYLLPWAFRYLALVRTAPLESNFYPILATLADHYLKQLQSDLKIIDKS